jgi:hypothetical protein
MLKFRVSQEQLHHFYTKRLETFGKFRNFFILIFLESLAKCKRLLPTFLNLHRLHFIASFFWDFAKLRFSYGFFRNFAARHRLNAAR